MTREQIEKDVKKLRATGAEDADVIDVLIDALVGEGGGRELAKRLARELNQVLEMGDGSPDCRIGDWSTTAPAHKALDAARKAGLFP